MSIDVKCPHCDEHGSVSDDRVGRRTACPTCGESFTVPLVSSGPPPIPSRRPSDRLDDETAGRPRPRDDEDRPSRRRSEDDDRPSRRRRPEPEPESSNVNKGMIVGGAVSLLIAITWFLVALIGFDRFFFYPPILAVIGIVSIVRGLLGHQSK